VRRIALALCLALTAVIAAGCAGAPINPGAANPSEGQLRLESKLGGSEVLRGLLSLGDLNAPPTLVDGTLATAILYYRSGEERTIETKAYIIIDIESLRGEPPRKTVGITVPDDVRVTQLARVVVILARPGTK
jgi:hypothetical protein